MTSSAVVGSSATMSLGSQASAHGDDHALLLPAGELVRVVVDPLLGVGDADQPRSSIAFARASLAPSRCGRGCPR